jgi:prevent-host-death family protein
MASPTSIPTNQTIQASEAKTHFLRILDDVERGQTITITRHGKTVARIVPDEAARQERIRAAFETMREIRKRVKPISIAQIIADKNEGRM